MIQTDAVPQIEWRGLRASVCKLVSRFERAHDDMGNSGSSNSGAKVSKSEFEDLQRDSNCT